jgi:hypothetical protein
MLTLMVLSSDDVEFISGVSASLSEGKEGAVETLYRDLLARGTNSAEPALMFAFPPLCIAESTITGNAIVRILDRVSGGVPIFGSVAVDHTVELRAPKTIYNGKCYSDRLPVVLLRGNVKPCFFACSVPRGAQIKRNAVITEANGNRLLSIDNMPAAAFMEKMGIVREENMDIIYAFPLVIDRCDGSEPLLISISKIDAEGALVSEQDIPSSGSITIGTIDEKLVINSTRYLVDRIKGTPPRNALLIFSCLSRILTFQNPMEEITFIRQAFADLPVPFLYVYSGGEICPRHKPGADKPVNNFYQFTVVACAF